LPSLRAPRLSGASPRPGLFISGQLAQTRSDLPRLNARQIGTDLRGGTTTYLTDLVPGAAEAPAGVFAYVEDDREKPDDVRADASAARA